MIKANIKTTFFVTKDNMVKPYSVYHLCNSIKKYRGVYKLEHMGKMVTIDTDLPQFANITPKQIVAVFNSIANR